MFGIGLLRQRIALLGEIFNAFPVSISTHERIQYGVALLKLGFLIAMILSAIIISGYANQNRPRFVPLGRFVSIQMPSSAFLAVSKAASTFDYNNSFDLQTDNQVYRCGIPHLETYAKVPEQDWSLTTERIGVDPPSIYSSSNHQGSRQTTPISSLVIFNSRNWISPPTIQLKSNGSSWSSTCYRVSTTGSPGLEVAVPSVVAFAFSAAGFHKLHGDFSNRLTIFNAILQTITIWFSIGGDLEYTLLAILPWCIMVPILVKMMICNRGICKRTMEEHEKPQVEQTLARLYCDGKTRLDRESVESSPALWQELLGNTKKLLSLVSELDLLAVFIAMARVRTTYMLR